MKNNDKTEVILKRSLRKVLHKKGFWSAYESLPSSTILIKEEEKHAREEQKIEAHDLEEVAA